MCGVIDVTAAEKKRRPSGVDLVHQAWPAGGARSRNHMEAGAGYKSRSDVAIVSALF